MKTDNQIQQDVRDEIKWDARITASDIGVTVKDGIVTIRGDVPHFIEKSASEDAAQRVSGVRAVANEIKVNIMNMSFKRTDQDIAEAAINTFKWNYQIPVGIKVSVEDGTVTLKGKAIWAFQKSAAKDAVKSLWGVKNVINDIEIKPSVEPAGIKTRIEAALKRSAIKESNGIDVAVEGGQVTLTGNVHSMAEKDDARWAAYFAPGVTGVENNISISAY